MPASVPEVAKVLGIPCPRCGALIGRYCDVEKRSICGERLAMVYMNDGVKAMQRLPVHTFENDGTGKCRLLGCGYTADDPIHQAKNASKITEIKIDRSTMPFHSYKNVGTGLCAAMVNGLMCNRKEDDSVHHAQQADASGESKIRVEQSGEAPKSLGKQITIERAEEEVRTLPVDVMPSGSEERDPRILTIPKINTKAE